MHPNAMLRQLTARPLDKPCDTPWESMVGDDKVRRCGACERDVYFLSGMSEMEAELRLLNAKDETPCIRYARDADGNVLHRPPIAIAQPYRPGGPARALVLASAIGGTIASRDAAAKGTPAPEPTQCVMYAEQPPAKNAPAPAPAPAAGPAAAAPAPAARAAAPAPSAPADTLPTVPTTPPPLAGAPMPIQRPVASGTLTVKSKAPCELKVHGLTLKAPLEGFRMTPGDFSAEVLGPGKKRRVVKFSIKAGEATRISLD